MKVTYIEKGDIFSLEGVRNFAHGCNCAGAMGKGIALQFRVKYPEMYKQYVKLCKSRQFIPGGVFDYCEDGTHIYNLGTQRSWRTKAEPRYIRMSLRKMLELASESQVTSIAMPAIGAGLGGLTWDSVKGIIEEIASEFSIDIVLFIAAWVLAIISRVKYKNIFSLVLIVIYGVFLVFSVLGIIILFAVLIGHF